MKERIRDLGLEEGAVAVGFASGERLKGPPSIDPAFILKGAKSVVSIMLPLDKKIIRDYLGKVNREGMQQHETEVYRRLFSIGDAIKRFIEAKKIFVFTKPGQTTETLIFGPFSSNS